MTPADFRILSAAAHAAPARGARLTMARGVWHTDDTPAWFRFEGPVTVAGIVAALTDQAVEIRRGKITISALLGEIDEVRADVSFRELGSHLSLNEAFELADSCHEILPSREAVAS